MLLIISDYPSTYHSVSLHFVVTLGFLPFTNRFCIRFYRFAENTMPAQGALPPVHRAQETQLAARGGERLATLPVPPRAPMPTTAHGSRFLAGAILRRRPGDQDVQRLLRAVSRLRQNDLRHLRNRMDVCQTQANPPRHRDGPVIQRTYSHS